MSTDGYINCGSTVNLHVCAVDLNKAFDKVNHNALLIKLINRKLPVELIDTLEHLLSNCWSCVKWKSSMSAFLGLPEPPFRTVLCFTADVSSFFVSPLVLRAASTDRPETLPHGRNLAEFYNATPKIRGGGGGLPPQKKWGQKHAKFRSILHHFRL